MYELPLFDRAAHTGRRHPANSRLVHKGCLGVQKNFFFNWTKGLCSCSPQTGTHIHNALNQKGGVHMFAQLFAVLQVAWSCWCLRVAQWPHDSWPFSWEVLHVPLNVLIYVSQCCHLVAWPCLPLLALGTLLGPLALVSVLTFMVSNTQSGRPRTQDLGLLGPQLVPPSCFLPLLNQTTLCWCYLSLLFQLGWPRECGAFAWWTWRSS